MSSDVTAPRTDPSEGHEAQQDGSPVPRPRSGDGPAADADAAGAEVAVEPVTAPAKEPESHPELRLPEPLKYTAAITSLLSVVTGLLFYFGASHAYWFFDYFGVNSTILELPAEEFLMRSVDGLFVPLVVAAGVVLLAIWVHRLTEPALAELFGQRGAQRVRTAVAAAVGLMALTIGALNALRIEVFAFNLAVPPLCLIAGVALLMYASRAHQRLRETPGHPIRGALEWAGVFALVSIGLFWAVHDYSAAAGVQRARVAAAGLPGYPSAVLYSANDLNLRGPGVRETRCGGGDSAYRYRYEGLKLVMQSGDMYLLLPAGWTRSDGAAVVIPRTDTVRFEFTVPGSDTSVRARC